MQGPLITDKEVDINLPLGTNQLPGEQTLTQALAPDFFAMPIQVEFMLSETFSRYQSGHIK